MPSIEENLREWDGDYEWAQQGDEWSRVWGGASPQWFGTILPRLKAFVPAARVLEIAPGFGRWTQFLRPLCAELVLVDVSGKCIEACRRRFAADTGIEYHVNDGRSLGMVADHSIDLVFSFDSLVHVESDILSSYIAEIATKLTPDGVAFLHHSNFGEYVDPATGQVAPSIENTHWRAPSVSAETVRQACANHGLVCVSQELVNWGNGQQLSDAITVAALRTSRWAERDLVLRNDEFMREAHYVARLASLYDWGPVPRGARP